MADAKLCDRCGKYYTEKDKMFQIHIGSTWGGKLSYIKLLSPNNRELDSFDLCDDCAEDLWNWLCNEEEVEEE